MGIRTDPWPIPPRDNCYAMVKWEEQASLRHRLGVDHR